MKILGAAAIAALIATIVFLPWLLGNSTDTRPYCPTEDSCVIDYRRAPTEQTGHWYINGVEVTK